MKKMIKKTIKKVKRKTGTILQGIYMVINLVTLHFKRRAQQDLGRMIKIKEI